MNTVADCRILRGWVKKGQIRLGQSLYVFLIRNSAITANVFIWLISSNRPRTAPQVVKYYINNLLALISTSDIVITLGTKERKITWLMLCLGTR